MPRPPRTLALRLLQLACCLVGLTGLVSCAPTQDDPYTLVVSAPQHTWLEIEPIFLDAQGQVRQRTQHRLWYRHEPTWRWWEPNRYELSAGPIADLPLMYRLQGDTIALDFRGQNGVHLRKYTFRGAWPAVQLHP